MRPPCEYVIKYLLPRIRAEIANVLINRYGWTQTEVARKLGTSQSAVSKYQDILASQTSLPSDTIKRFGESMAGFIVNGRIEPDEFVRRICELCIGMRISGPFCRIHKDEVPSLPEHCRVCWLLMERGREISDEREAVLRNLSAALRRVIRNKGFVKLIPEVRMNMVMALTDAKTINDIAGIPGRITVVRNRPFAAYPPEFGASKHLASMLLRVREVFEEVRAIICIKYDHNVDSAMKLQGYDIIYVRRDEGDLLPQISAMIRGRRKVPDAIVDKGGWGVEPVTYILGRDAVDAVKKCEEILAGIGGSKAP